MKIIPAAQPNAQHKCARQAIHCDVCTFLTYSEWHEFIQ